MAKMDQTLRFLVADDEARLQVIMQLWLQKAGHTVVIAQNGQEALRLLTAEPFDVITDVNMPMLNGIEMVRQLLAGGRPPRLIIILTSRCDVDDLQREFSVSGVRIFAKPFSPRDMMNLIEDYFVSLETRS